MDPTSQTDETHHHHYLAQKHSDDHDHQFPQKHADDDDDDDHHHSTQTTDPFSILLQPIQWLQMLSSQINPSFIFGVVLVYGLSQGFSGSFFKVVTDYYWKDVQKVQPSVVQLYIGLYYIPWVMKPVWGMLTDVFPVKGYRRRPYFVLAGVLGTASSLMVAVNGNLSAAAALIFLVGATASVAIADVTIDACIARNSIEIRSLASDLQSLCAFCSSAGALVGYSPAGFLFTIWVPRYPAQFLSFSSLSFPSSPGLFLASHPPEPILGIWTKKSFSS